MTTTQEILAALTGGLWRDYPEKIEMSPATLFVLKEAVLDSRDPYRPLPPYGVPVFVDPTVPDGQGRVTWQDGRIEYIGTPQEPEVEVPIPSEESTRRVLPTVAVIILIGATIAACVALCLLIRGPWWGKAIDCAGFTGCALYAWWLMQHD